MTVLNGRSGFNDGWVRNLSILPFPQGQRDLEEFEHGDQTVYLV